MIREQGIFLCLCYAYCIPSVNKYVETILVTLKVQDILEKY